MEKKEFVFLVGFVVFFLGGSWFDIEKWAVALSGYRKPSFSQKFAFGRQEMSR